MTGATLLFGLLGFCGLLVLLAMVLAHAKRDVTVDITLVELHP